MRLSFRPENPTRKNGTRQLTGPEAAGAALADCRLREFSDAMTALGNPGATPHGVWPDNRRGWVLEAEDSASGSPTVIVATDGYVYAPRDPSSLEMEELSASEFLFRDPSPISPTYRALDFARQLSEILTVHGGIIIETSEADEIERRAQIEQELRAWTSEEAADASADPIEDVIDITESSFLDDESVVEIEASARVERTAEVTRERTGQIVEAVLVVLAGHPDGLSAAEAIALVEKRLTLTEFECSEYPNSPGTRRFDKIVKFSTIPPRKAGWIEVDAGTWTITAGGTAMIGRYDDPADLAREAARLYREWKKAPRTGDVSEPDAETDESPADTETDIYGEAEIASLAENEAEAASLAEISRLIERLHLISRSSD